VTVNRPAVIPPDVAVWLTHSLGRPVRPAEMGPVRRGWSGADAGEVTDRVEPLPSNAASTATAKHQPSPSSRRFLLSKHVRMYAGQRRRITLPEASRSPRNRMASRSARSRSARSNATAGQSGKASNDWRSSSIFPAFSRPLTVRTAVVPSVARCILSINPFALDATLGPFGEPRIVRR
jgi:hypothetical protein